MSSACELCARVAGLRAGRDPWFVAELDRGFVVLSENQGCPGWCVLVLKGHAEHLAELPIMEQQSLFGDVARVAGAVRAVFPASGASGGPPRINYECLGNVAPHIHWHIIPRHADDPEPRKPVWGWAAERLRGSMSDGERDDLVRRLREALTR